MAILGFDGYDAYNGIGANLGLGSKWTVSAGVALDVGRFGGQAVLVPTGAIRSIRRAVNAVNITNGSVCFSFKQADLSATNIIALIEAAITNAQMHVAVLNTGAIQVARSTVAAGTSGGTALVTSAAGVIKPDTWHFVEITFSIHDTTGSCTVKVDGVSVATITNVDTKFSATAGWANFLLIATANINTWFDDAYWTDGASLGERRVETVYPTGDVTGAQDFVPLNGGAHFEEVDEAQANDTDYVEGSTVGNVDRYTFAPLAGSPNVDAVQLNAFAMKTDAGTRALALQVKSGGTTSDGPDSALAASYGKIERLLLTDPNGSIAWTAAAVNALEAGVKVTV